MKIQVIQTILRNSNRILTSIAMMLVAGMLFTVIPSSVMAHDTYAWSYAYYVAGADSGSEPVVLQLPYYHEVQERVWDKDLQVYRFVTTNVKKGYTSTVSNITWYTPYMRSYAYSYSYAHEPHPGVVGHVWNGVKWVADKIWPW